MPAIAAIADLSVIEDDRSYALVAAARRALNGWRNAAVKRCKDELEVMLAHYRADHW